MRLKFVIPVLLLALVVLGFTWLRSTDFLVEKSMEPVGLPPVHVLATATQSVANPTMVTVQKPVVPPPAAMTSVADQMTIHSPMVEELQSLAMNSDADSLKSILAALTNSDPEIREAARDAAIQFGDRAAAPALRAAAAQVESPEEISSLFAAADFLELPPLEVHASTNPPPARLSPPAAP